MKIPQACLCFRLLLQDRTPSQFGIVAFRSAKVAFFRGAKDDFAHLFIYGDSGRDRILKSSADEKLRLVVACGADGSYCELSPVIKRLMSKKFTTPSWFMSASS